MQIQILKDGGTEGKSELIAWLYIDCAEEKLVDSITLKGYKVKAGKSLNGDDMMQIKDYYMEKGENA